MQKISQRMGERGSLLIPGSHNYVEQVLRWVLLCSPGQAAPSPSALTSGDAPSPTAASLRLLLAWRPYGSKFPCWVFLPPSSHAVLSRRGEEEEEIFKDEWEMLTETGVEAAYPGTMNIGISTVLADWDIRLLCYSLSSPISSCPLHHPASSAWRKKVIPALNPLQRHPLMSFISVQLILSASTQGWKRSHGTSVMLWSLFIVFADSFLTMFLSSDTEIVNFIAGPVCYLCYAEPGAFCSLFSTGKDAINILIITYTHIFIFFNWCPLFDQIYCTSIFLQEAFYKRGCGWDFSLGKGLFCHKAARQKYACVLTFSVLGCGLVTFEDKAFVGCLWKLCLCFTCQQHH